jgi:hypothetical protein
VRSGTKGSFSREEKALNMTTSGYPRLAFALGILLPLGETVRRWGHWDTWIFWIDDFIIGALLLFGAWAVRRRQDYGMRVLAAGWGVAFGMLYPSFFNHLAQMAKPDVGRFPHRVLTAMIGVAFFGSILGLWSILRDRRDRQNAPVASEDEV